MWQPFCHLDTLQQCLSFKLLKLRDKHFCKKFKWQNVFQIIWQKLFKMGTFWNFDFCHERKIPTTAPVNTVRFKACLETILEALMLIKSIISSKAFFYVIKSTQNQQVGKVFEKSLASRSCLKHTSLVIKPLTCD